MANKFRALLVTKDGDRQSAAVTELIADIDLGQPDPIFVGVAWTLEE